MFVDKKNMIWYGNYGDNDFCEHTNQLTFVGVVYDKKKCVNIVKFDP